MPDADVVFASIQTLSRREHLERFAPDSFDYVVVDEFHHAAAASYRKLIALLPSEVPARADGDARTERRRRPARAVPAESRVSLRSRRRRSQGPALAVPLLRRAGRCGLHQYSVAEHTIRRGGPDDGGGDPAPSGERARAVPKAGPPRERLDSACHSATLTSWRTSSRRSGLRAVAVHSGSTSAPRASSLEQLDRRRTGHRLCRGHVQRRRRSADARHRHDAAAHGVEDPLASAVRPRPSEGARQGAADRHRLHRQPPRVPAQAADAVRLAVRRPRNLQPAGAPAEPDAGAAAWLRGDVRAREPSTSSSRFCAEARRRPTRSNGTTRTFNEVHGVRPTAVEVYQDGYNPRSVRERSGSWAQFVASMGDLTQSTAQRSNCTTGSSPRSTPPRWSRATRCSFFWR